MKKQLKLIDTAVNGKSQSKPETIYKAIQDIQLELKRHEFEVTDEMLLMMSQRGRKLMVGTFISLAHQQYFG